MLPHTHTLSLSLSLSHTHSLSFSHLHTHSLPPHLPRAIPPTLPLNLSIPSLQAPAYQELKTTKEVKDFIERMQVVHRGEIEEALIAGEPPPDPG